jgi:hypothetical protein
MQPEFFPSFHIQAQNPSEHPHLPLSLSLFLTPDEQSMLLAYKLPRTNARKQMQIPDARLGHLFLAIPLSTVGATS